MRTDDLLRLSFLCFCNLLLVSCQTDKNQQYIVERAIAQMNTDALDEMGHIVLETESVCYGVNYKLYNELLRLENLVDQNVAVCDLSVNELKDSKSGKEDLIHNLSNLTDGQQAIAGYILSVITDNSRVLVPAKRDSAYLRGYTDEFENQYHAREDKLQSINDYLSIDGIWLRILASVTERNKWMDLLLNVLRGTRTGPGGLVYPVVLHIEDDNGKRQKKTLEVGLAYIDYSFDRSAVKLIYDGDTIEAKDNIFTFSYEKKTVPYGYLNIEVVTTNPLTGEVYSREHDLQIN